MSLYRDLVAAGIPLDSHESDLYALATPEAVAIVTRSREYFESFISELDGRRWLDVPFAFEPWWERRAARPVTG